MRCLHLSLFTLAVALLCQDFGSVAAANERLFVQLDQNEDGWVTADEIQVEHRRLFDRLLRIADDDRDGRLSSSEFQAGLQPQLAEKPLVKKQGSELPGGDALLLLLAKMDVNTNGQIESDEVPGPFRDIFDRIEKRLGGESDGILDRRELTQSAPRLSQIALRVVERMDLDVDVELAMLSEKQWNSVQAMVGQRRRGEALADPKRAREFFRQLDANNDGQITLAEVPDQIAQRFEQLMDRADRNNDDQISEQELMAVSRALQTLSTNRPAPKQRTKDIEQTLKQLDRDGDRRISRKEAPRRIANRFNRLDADGSGYLEREEVAILVELRSRLRRPETRQPSRSANAKRKKK